MIRRVVHAFADGSRSLVRGWRSSVLALAAIVSAVFVLGAFLMVSGAVDRTLRQWSEAAEISVFLRDDVESSTRASIERTLREHPGVLDVRFVSAEEARRRFVASFPDLAPLVDGDASLPASLEARLSRDADMSSLVTLADGLRKTSGVADLRLDRDLLSNLLTLARVGRFVGGGLAVVLIMAAALAIASVVRLSYVARRDEVDVMYLLGAPLSAIRGPFVAEGILQGAVGTGLALGGLAAAHSLMASTVGTGLGELRLAFLPGWQLAAVVAGGVFVGGAAGLVAVGGDQDD